MHASKLAQHIGAHELLRRFAPGEQLKLRNALFGKHM